MSGRMKRQMCLNCGGDFNGPDGAIHCKRCEKNWQANESSGAGVAKAYNGSAQDHLGEPSTWEEIARALFDLLDDIDTSDDLAKENQNLYRNLVRRHHKDRFKYATTDGYTVIFNTLEHTTPET